MSVRRVANYATVQQKNHTNRLASVLSVARPVHSQYAVGVLQSAGQRVHSIPELRAHIILNVVEDALEKAERVLRDQFFREDGRDTLNRLCAALFDMRRLNLTDKDTRTDAMHVLTKVSNKLRAFVGRVNGWESPPNTQVTLEQLVGMCTELEKLLADEPSTPSAPPLSRQRANAFP